MSDVKDTESEGLPSDVIGDDGVGDADGGERPGWSRALVGAVGALVVLAMCAVMFVTAQWGTPISRPVLKRYPADALAWADSGRLAVAQLWDRSGVPYVAAWEIGSAPRVARGFRAVAVESVASRVWVVRDDGTQYVPGADTPAPDVMTDDVDAVPEALFLWDLATSGSVPVASAEARWAPWEGPGASTAYLEIDASRGALPSAMRFRDAAGGEIEAVLPADVVTFVPLGWSPSGRYFAVQALARLERPWDNSVDALGDPRPVILDTSTGLVVADESRESITGQGWPWAVWGPSADRLFFVSTLGLVPDSDMPGFDVRFLDPDRTTGYWGDGLELPPEWGRTPDLRVQGGAPGAVTVLAAADDEWTVWRVEGSETVRACVLAVASPPLVAPASGRILAVDYAGVDPEARLSVFGPDGSVLERVRPLE